MKSYLITVTSKDGKMSFVGATSWARVLEIQIQYRGMGFTTSVSESKAA